MKAITGKMTEGQKKQYKRFVEDAAERALKEVDPDKDGLQKLIENGDEFQLRIVTAVRELSVSNQFADEETESSYGYLSGYKPKGLTEQTNRLRELFYGIGYANQELLAQIEKGEVDLPAHAEGWFAIPNWMKNPKIFGATYSEAFLRVLDTIRQARNGKFYTYREGQLDEKLLRQSARTQKLFADLAEAQGNPGILIVPAQFGIRHRGRSVRRACEVFVTNEFGLGAFAVGIIILTHPKRLMNYDDLWIDCAGDEFPPEADGGSYWAPYFGGVEFGAGVVGFCNVYCGSVSGSSRSS